MNILDAVDAASLRKDIPQFRAGDELKIHVRVIEGNKSRLQVFQGIVIRRQVMEFARLSQSVRFHTALVLSVHSQFTLQLLKRSS